METQRHLLEELEVLETAAAQRFRRNPLLGNAAGITRLDKSLESNPKRPHKETLFQQHELALFARQYKTNCERIARNTKSGLPLQEFKLMKDPKFTFDVLTKRLDQIPAASPEHDTNASSVGSAYQMYLSALTEELTAEAQILKRSNSSHKRKHFLSSSAAHLQSQLEQLFSESEMYGKYVDLTMCYESYKLITQKGLSYTEYLDTFLSFEDLPKSAEAIRYLEELLQYLETFYTNLFPLSVLTFPLEPPVDCNGAGDKTDSSGDAVPNSDGSVFCVPCNKSFAKESVYKGHLSGKKHLKNAAQNNKVPGAPAQTSGASQPPASVRSASVLKSKIRHMSSLLSKQISGTINDHTRRSTMSERERTMEVYAVAGEESDFTDLDSDRQNGGSDSENDDDIFTKALPLGTDGIPIPIWLYKLQGLHRSYTCEVCGNKSYKGRVVFNKHFTLPKHVHGLSCLGVEELDIPLFANVSKISEVQDLLKRTQKDKKRQSEIHVDGVEVEDDEGNVMSSKDYEELKKQGLI